MVFKVIEEGQQAMIFNPGGQGRLIVGPRRIWLGAREELEFLQRSVATQMQYLIVKHRDGHKEHVPGPCEMFLNRLEMESIVVANAVTLDANNLLVVYKQEEGKIERRIVQGPTIFVPNAHEWLHEFIWHGSDPQNPGRFMPRRNVFTKLCHVPSQFYYDVKDVRTNDDTLITVKLMLFYELTDIETMLNYTHDPIADFINAVGADIISFASQKSYEEFLQDTHELNSLDTYPQLQARCAHIGYTITKVVYRGYLAPSALQATHDEAIETRTHLRLQTESVEQTQKMEEFKLKREKERTKLKQEMERRLQEHTQELQKLDQTNKLDKEKVIHEAKLKKEFAAVEMRVAIERSQHEQKVEFLRSLKEMGVDMTRYLISLQPEFVPENEIIVAPATRTVTRGSKPGTARQAVHDDNHDIDDAIRDMEQVLEEM